MPQSLEQEIVALQDLHGSSRDPNGRAFVPLADAYRRAGRLDDALALLKEGLAKHPEFTSAHVVSSWVHIERGALDEALGTLELVLELDKENRAGLMGMGRVLHEKGDREGAIEHLGRLAELEPEDAEARELLDAIQAAEPPPAPPVGEEEPTAVQIPEIVVDDFDPTAEPEPVAAETGVEAEAPPADEPALDEAPLVAEEIVTRSMGDVYADQGLLDKAIEVYERLTAAAPDDEGLAARLAELTEQAAAQLTPESAGVAEEPAVEAAAPAAVAIGDLAPEAEGVTTPEADDRPVVPIASLAPEGGRPVVPISVLAPDA